MGLYLQPSAVKSYQWHLLDLQSINIPAVFSSPAILLNENPGCIGPFCYLSLNLILHFETLILSAFCYPRLKGYQIPPVQYFVLPICFNNFYFQPILNVLCQYLQWIYQIKSILRPAVKIPSINPSTPLLVQAISVYPRMGILPTLWFFFSCCVCSESCSGLIFFSSFFRISCVAP